MRKDIDLLANRFILLKSGNPLEVSQALKETQAEIVKSRPFYLLPERFIICRLNEAGEAVKYVARAAYYADALLKEPESLPATGEEEIMVVAAAVAKHLQDLVAIRISPLPLKVEVTGRVARFSGESLPVRFLNSLIVMEATWLMQLHLLVRGRFTEPDELCAYCWELFSEREMTDALRMAESAGLNETQFSQFVEALLDTAKRRPQTMKRVAVMAEALTLDQPSNPSNEFLGPVGLAFALVALILFLFYLRE